MKIQSKKKKQKLLKPLKSLFADIADNFIEYIHSLDPNEIQELDDDLKANRWEAETLLEIENAYELLTIFQMFYYFSGRLSLTNDLFLMVRCLKVQKK